MDREVVCPKCAAELAANPIPDRCPFCSTRILHPESPDRICVPVSASSRLVEEDPSHFDPNQLGLERDFVVVENSPECLRYHTSKAGHPRMGYVTVIIHLWLIASTVGFEFGWAGLQNKQPLNWVAVAGGVGALFLELAFLAFLIFTFFGKLTVTLNAERLVSRWHIAHFGLTRQLATPDVSRVVVQYKSNSNANGGLVFALGRLRFIRRTWPSKYCLAYAGKRPMSLGLFVELATARKVAGMIRFQLRRLGQATDDV